MSEEVQTIVIDNGSCLIKSGFGGEESPRSVFPTIIGRRKIPLENIYGKPYKDLYIGDEACAKVANLILNYPIEHGIITNWDDMEKIWHHMFYNELHVDPSEHPVLLTESANNPKFNREKLIEYMFETFNVPSMYLAVQNLLSLYASGRTTGLVFDLGDTTSSSVPIYEGYSLPFASNRINFAGRDITKWMQDLLYDQIYKFTESEQFEIARDIKEKHAYIALDYDAELLKAKSSSSESDVKYKLPDGNIVSFTDELFRCSELLFKSQMNELEYDSVHKIIIESINKSDKDIRNELYENIVISGGTSLIEGLPQRIEKEITKLAPENTKIKIIAVQERKYLAWMGGSILSSLVTFPQMVITKDEYKEEGSKIINRKFLY